MLDNADENNNGKSKNTEYVKIFTFWVILVSIVVLVEVSANAIMNIVTSGSSRSYLAIFAVFFFAFLLTILSVANPIVSKWILDQIPE